MYVLNNICFVCLTESDTHVVFRKETEVEIFTQLKYILPELMMLDSEIPVEICSSCRTELQSFYTFKKKCLANYKQWKHYIQTLKETSNNQHQRYSELQVRLINYGARRKRKKKQNIKMNIKKENRNSLKIFSELPIKIDDNKQLEKEEQSMDIVLNIKNENEDVILSFIATKEQVLPMNVDLNQQLVMEEAAMDNILNIKNENHHAIAAQNKIDQELNQELVSSESVSDNVGGLCVLSELQVKTLLQQEPELKIKNDNEASKLSSPERDNLPTVLYNTININEEPSSQVNETHQKTIIEDYIVVKDELVAQEVFVIKLNVPDENEDVLLSSDEQNKHKILAENSIEAKEDSLASEDSGVQQLVNSESAQDGGSSITLDKDKINSKYRILFQCSICSVQYSDSSEFNTHLNTHVKDLTGSECSICSKKMTAIRLLRRHTKLHLTIKFYICSNCNEQFKTYLDLLQHMNTHKKPKKPRIRNRKAFGKQYECTICNLKYTQNFNLKRHINTYHLGIKNLECSICKRRFAEKRDLKNHVKRHLGIRDYICSICNNGYVDANELKKHMKYHFPSLSSDKKDSANLSYECTVCNKRFLHKYQLYAHLKCHQAIKDHKCHKCDKSYTKRAYLKYHLLCHLKNEEKERKKLQESIKN